MVTTFLVVTSHAQDSTNVINPDDLDTSISPCTDFYQYANGGWIQRNPIPPDESQWRSTSILRAKNERRLRDILEHLTPTTQTSNAAKLATYYRSCMNTAQIAADNVSPLRPLLQRIDTIKTNLELVNVIGSLHQIGVNVFFNINVAADLTDPATMILEISQGGLGLFARDYYIDEDAHTKKIRDAYTKHVAHILALANGDTPKSEDAAAAVLSIETALAQHFMTLAERRNPQATYHRLATDVLQAQMPHFSWATYFRVLGRNAPTELNVRQPKFFMALDQVLATASLDALKSYLRWHLLHVAAPELSSAFVNEDFSFYGEVLEGSTQQPTRWKHCVRSTDRALGDALGQEYVKHYFPPQSKARILHMVDRLKAVLHDRIVAMSWMDPSTQREALAKLAAIRVSIGYPDKWRDYTHLTITPAPYLNNFFAAERARVAELLSQIGKPVDRGAWEMSPPTVDAYNNQRLRVIAFPAGILQPPYYNPRADNALNYGAIGAVIGHELTHAFDDQGRRFDAAGHLREWWTEKDRTAFETRAACVRQQFDAFTIDAQTHVNGELVLGESIADLGGLSIAYAALLQTEQAQTDAKVNGFTLQQRFFLSWAHLWASNTRPEFAREWTKVSPTPLPQFRVRGPLSNLPPFRKAFSCKNGDAMVRTDAQQCRVW